MIICTAASAITTPVRAADATVTVSEDTNTNFATTNTMATFQDCACKEGRLTIKIDQYSLPFSYCAYTSAYLNKHDIVMCLPQLSSHARYTTSGVARAMELVGHHCASAKALTTPTN